VLQETIFHVASARNLARFHSDSSRPKSNEAPRRRRQRNFWDQALGKDNAHQSGQVDNKVLDFGASP
jgi:hypothetical protein